MNAAEIEALLDKYQKGETTSKENKLIENWLLNCDSQQSAWDILDVQRQEQWLNALLNRIDATIEQQDNKVIQLDLYKKWWRRPAVAAAILIIFVIVLIGWPGAKSLLFKDDLVSLKTSPSTTKQITLSDGSKVWINKGSELKYAVKFSGKTREVYLSGEAYFDIKHDNKHPFIVHTGRIFTTVLGTAFNINSNDLLHRVVVTVTRGKVSVSDEENLLGFLTPNQQIACNTLNNGHQRTRVDALTITAWLKNELYFEDVTFAEAAKELEKRFNIKIIFSNDKARKCRFTATLLKGKSIDQILKVICAFNNANYQKQENGNIIINGNGCE